MRGLIGWAVAGTGLVLTGWGLLPGLLCWLMIARTAVRMGLGELGNSEWEGGAE